MKFITLPAVFALGVLALPQAAKTDQSPENALLNKRDATLVYGEMIDNFTCRIADGVSDISDAIRNVEMACTDYNWRPAGPGDMCRLWCDDEFCVSVPRFDHILHMLTNYK
ncbi:hypothetical protein BGZ63DRAFT_403203 [Mariannaea sp. PMI_226]|nr:hypothetical protein BGZ63DRAFT_403203 [Mariannaea sp. PMI_226]